jgi:hypothetical protein
MIDKREDKARGVHVLEIETGKKTEGDSAE